MIHVRRLLLCMLHARYITVVISSSNLNLTIFVHVPYVIVLGGVDGSGGMVNDLSLSLPCCSYSWSAPVRTT